MEQTGNNAPPAKSSSFTWLIRFAYCSVMLLLVAIAIPSFVKARTTSAKSACVANLKQIDDAIKQWALENKKTDSEPFDMTEVTKLLKGGVIPSCPAGGTYSPGITVGNKPTCSLEKVLGPSHSLK